MTNSFSKALWVAVNIFLLSLTITSCDKPEDINLTPEEVDTSLLNLEKTVMITPSATVVTVDSIRTDNLSRFAIGTNYEPVFGNTWASFATSFSLPNDGLNFDGVDSFESVVLNVVYGGADAYFGDLSQKQSFIVYELNETLNTTDTFYSNHKLSYLRKIGTWNGNLQPGENFLSINLDKELFQEKFLNTTADSLTNSGAFQKFFKGIAIVPSDTFSNNEGAIIYILRESSDQERQTNISFNYNNTSQVITLLNTNKCVNVYRHDYNKGSIKIGENSDKIYAQPLAGVKTNIVFPKLKDLKNKGNLAIHKAVLKLSLSTYHMNVTPPGRILVTGANENLDNTIIPDLLTLTGDLIEDNGTEYYEISLTRYIQETLTKMNENPDYMDYGVNILIPSDNPPDNPLIANPLVVENNEGNPDVQLTIFYTKVEE